MAASLPASAPSPEVATMAASFVPHVRRRNIVVHALPCARTASGVVLSVLLVLLHTLLLLSLILLLFKSVLVGSRACWSCRSRRTETTTVRWALIALTALPALSTLLHAHHSHHLRHLLHLLRVHVVHRSIVRPRRLRVRRAIRRLAYRLLLLLLLRLLHRHHLLHLLHHHRVHLSTHGCHGIHLCLLVGHVAGDGLLHHLEILLHSLPILCHRSRTHPIHHRILTLLLLVVVEALVVLLTVILAAIELVSAKLPATIFFAHIAPRLCSLHLDWLPMDFQRPGKSPVNSFIAIEGNEPKTTGTARIFVHHQCRINDSSELHEELFEVAFCRFLTHTANKNLTRSFLLFARNSTLGIDLEEQVNHLPGSQSTLYKTYNLSVEVMLLDHDGIDSFRILECQEAEPARATSSTVTHHGAFHDFTELGKVVA